MGGSASAKPSSDAKKAFAVERTVINQLATGQAGPAWTHLVPAQQALVSRTAYINCRSASNALSVDNVRLVSSYREQIVIPGTSFTTDSVALVARVTLANGHGETVTAHLVKVRQSWRYVLQATEVMRCSSPT
jgi:hypothetical protein